MKDSHSIGVALVGVGMVSGTYADALSTLIDRLHLTGVLSTRASTANAFVKKFSALTANTAATTPVVYTSAQQLADDPAVKFVLLTTPPDARESLVKLFAAAGKPILMEKPVERTLAAAQALCAIAEQHNVPLGIMLQHRARPSAGALADIVRSGMLGELRVVEISVPWWRDQTYYDQPGRGTYARDGGGVLISQAIHTLDLALQFTGSVKSVVALTGTSGFHDMEAEDFVAAGLQFSNGAIGNLFASTACYPGRSEEIVLHFAQASARLQSSLLTLDWQDGRHERIGESAASGAGADPMAFTSDWHRSMLENFAAVVRQDAQPIATGRSALPVHALIEALERSGKSGRTEFVQQPSDGGG